MIDSGYFSCLGEAVAARINAEAEIISRHFWAVLRDKGDAAVDTADRPTVLKWCQEREDSDRAAKLAFESYLVFVYPFVCFCCGKQISARQFAFSSYCGTCDCGHCKHHKKWLFESWPEHERAKIKPRISRFIDGEIVDLDLMDVMRLKRLLSWGGL